MKHPAFRHSSCTARSSRRDGVALVLVLAFLVLICGLVIAFFSSVTTELSTAKKYSDGVATKQLADAAVNVVVGHVREATSGNGLAWASQPGMIRTYDERGVPESYYKLYSSDNLIVNRSQIPGFQPESDLLPDWDARPAQFVDLNSPTLVADPGNPTGPQKPRFPIVDPRAVDNGVEGFDYTGDISTGGSLNGVVKTTTADDKDQRRLPMPVRWIYMLKDGKLTAPTDADATSATWDAGKLTNSSALPTANNPIVGRIAFWTDDDTSKVNVNTASEGTYWDTPLTPSKPTSADIESMAGKGENIATPTGTGDWQLAEYQGAQKEYQRYPGHPATTCLSAIFGKSIVSKTQELTGNGQSVDRGTIVKALTDLAPRVRDLAVEEAASSRSSMGGTQQAQTAKDGQVGVKVDSDRLYANVDEFVFDPSRQVQGLGSDFRDTIETARFFLTANSRAPEENLFGKPRVAIWPLTKGQGKIDDPTDVSKMTTFDKLIARAATVGEPSSSNSLQYYFTREDPKSQTTDWSWRNKSIYSYLQKLTARNIPGFGGNFLAKYPAPSIAGATASERDQILTEIFDYIRCTNLVDSSEGTTKAYTDP
ncbi:MAG TPA: Verru_Chthon cassette protein A, partial [Roseimicrobium sp.]|nr:Verru_Chthon cassette protein A [Roseimicrobium sp.]